MSKKHQPLRKSRSEGYLTKMAILRELERITERVMSEEAAKDDHFARIYASQQAFKEDYAHWKSRAYLPRDF